MPTRLEGLERGHQAREFAQRLGTASAGRLRQDVPVHASKVETGSVRSVVGQWVRSPQTSPFDNREAVIGGLGLREQPGIVVVHPEVVAPSLFYLSGRPMRAAMDVALRQRRGSRPAEPRAGRGALSRRAALRSANLDLERPPRVALASSCAEPGRQIADVQVFKLSVMAAVLRFLQSRP